jgi:hypothetical protein
MSCGKITLGGNMKIRLVVIVPILVAFSLSSCQPRITPTTPPPSAIPVISTPSATVAPTPTSLPRWRLYEIALSKAVLFNSDTGLCEWEILGQSGQEVYMWTLCIDTQGVGTAASTPAVVHLAENGQINDVTVPRPAGDDYWEDILSLFPPDVLAKIRSRSFDGAAADKRIEERMRSHEPPLIATSGIVLP